MEDYVKLILNEGTDIKVVDELIKILEWEWCIEWGKNNCVLVDEDDLSIVIESFNQKGISFEIVDSEESDFLKDEDDEDFE